MDDKRYFRNLKKHVKKVGNRRRRHYLKDIDINPSDFDFGYDESSAFNGRDGINRKSNSRKKWEEQQDYLEEHGREDER